MPKGVTLRGDCRSGGCFSAPARCRCRLCHAHCRRFSRSWSACVADYGLPHPLRDGPAMKLRWRLANHLPLKVIHRRCLPNYRHWSSVPEMALAAAARLPLFYAVLTEAMTSRTPLPTPRGPSSTVTLVAVSPTGEAGHIRLSILKRRSAAQ